MIKEQARDVNISSTSWAVPLEYQAMIRTFIGTVEKCEAFVNGGTCWKVSVIKANEKDSNNFFYISCFSFEELTPGQTVSGLTCKLNGSILEGIIIPSYYEPLMELSDFDVFFESLACGFYSEYYIHDYRRSNSFFHAKFSNAENDRYCKGDSKQAILLRAARVMDCHFKGRKEFVWAKYILQEDEVVVERYLERHYEPGTIIYVLLFRGHRDEMVHIHSIYGTFVPMLLEQLALIEQFLNDGLFLFACEIIHKNSRMPVDPDVPVRVMITNTPRLKNNLCVFGRLISATYSKFTNNGLNGDRETDAIVKTDHELFIIGKIYTMTAQTASEGYRLIRYMPLNKSDPNPVPVITGNSAMRVIPVIDNKDNNEDLSMATEEIPDNYHRDNEEDDSTSLGFITGCGIGDNKDDKQISMGDFSLFAIHPAEFSVMPQTQKRPFKARYVQMMVENGTMWKLHYDILYWIGYLEFANVILIQNLIRWGYIDGSYQGCMLSDVHQKQINSFKVINERAQMGWEDNEEVEFIKPVSIDKFSKLISDMFEWGLLDCLRFQRQDCKPSATIIYILSDKGSMLLQRMNRKTRPDDEFAFARSPVEIKTILSGNQLYVSYLCHLKGYVTEKDSHVRKAYFIKQANSRPKFDLVFRYGDKKLNIWGESIRGYTGISKVYHLYDRYGKIERFKKTIDSLMQENGERYCMVFVFQSYSSMKENTELVCSAFDREWTCPVLLTYDTAVIGRFTKSHFLLDLPTGQLQKVNGLIEYFKSVIDSST